MIKRKFLSIAMAAAVAVSSMSALSVPVSAKWYKSDSGYSYKDDETGKKLTGWQTIDGGKYLFDKKGYAYTGWVTVGDNKYYFNGAKKGKMLTGWNKIGDSRYYFGQDGKMRTGWVKLSGKTYYFGTNGKMRTGKLKINGKTYDFGKDGILKNNSSDSAKILKPLKGMKWGMTSKEVIKAGDFDEYTKTGPMLIVTDSTPYMYYLFGKDNKLSCVGFFSTDVNNNKTKFKDYFEDAGWEELVSTNKNGAKTIVYSNGNQYGGLYYTSDSVMTMIFSDQLSDDIENGTDISDIFELE